MGFFSAIKNAATQAVGKVAEAATGGGLGKMIAQGLERFGLPKEICGIVACIGDPTYSTKFLTKELDRVGRALGLPEELTGALKKVVENAEEYAQAFARGGFGEVVCELGKDLGLPPELYLAVAAGVDAYSGNAAGASVHLMELAGRCARHLGVPEGAIDIVEFAGAAYSRDVDGMIAAGADIVDGMDVLPKELDTALQLGAAAYTGDDKGVKEQTLKLAGQTAERLGLPPEASSVFNLAVAYQSGDKDAIEAALRDVGEDVVARLPSEYQTIASKAADLFAQDPEAALAMMKDLPKAARQGFDALVVAARDPETLALVADKGIEQLPPEYQGPLKQAVGWVAKDPAAAWDSVKDFPEIAKEGFRYAAAAARDPVTMMAIVEPGIQQFPLGYQDEARQAFEAFVTDPKSTMEAVKGWPDQARNAFFALLDKATDPAYVKEAAKSVLDEQVPAFSKSAQRAYELGLHLMSGDKEALKSDLGRFAEAEIQALPPSLQELLQAIRAYANGDEDALDAKLADAKREILQDLTDHYQLPMRV